MTYVIQIGLQAKQHNIMSLVRIKKDKRLSSVDKWQLDKLEFALGSVIGRKVTLGKSYPGFTGDFVDVLFSTSSEQDDVFCRDDSLEEHVQKYLKHVGQWTGLTLQPFDGIRRILIN